MPKKREPDVDPKELRKEFLRANQSRYKQLESVVRGMYQEIEKLAKKSPADQVSELMLNRMNSLITKCKEAMTGDEFIDSLTIFVAAGERPENRDALIVLRELMQGLDRHGDEVRALR